MGLPSRQTYDALAGDLQLWRNGKRNPGDYGAIVEVTRSHYARLVNIDAGRVAIGSQTSVLVSLFAAAAPAGAEILCVDGDFSSVVFPFLQRDDIRVRCVPVAELAASVTEGTWLVAYSLVQSSSGEVADVSAIAAAAKRCGSYTLCDTTQATGVHPVNASDFDATVCHAYKWLCCPRGVAFLTVSEELCQVLAPVHAGWYAGEDVWGSCYGPDMALAPLGRKFDVSPAWPAWVGAEPAIRLFAGLDIAEIWSRTSALGDALCDAIGIPQQHQAIVTWADPDGVDLTRLTDAGLTVSGRAGRLRTAFHLWNDESDVTAVARALGK